MPLHLELTAEDWLMGQSILGEWRDPDLTIAPDGTPYLYRWYVIPHNKDANVYLHVQISDDPERPLHDHPWVNQSVILSGGYHETYANVDDQGRLLGTHQRWVRKGDVIQRPADQAHRLFMAPGVRYSMSLFSTGPKTREWGFWYPDGWVNANDVCRIEGNVSIHVRR